jgi:hypothetical protein
MKKRENDTTHWLKKQRSDEGHAVIKHQRRQRMPRKISVPAKSAPVTAKDVLQGHLEGRDPVTKSWAVLIAPVISRMQQRFEIPLEEVLDWIYTHEPADVFEFCDWARTCAHGNRK